MDPIDWCMYPRGPALLEEVAATVDEAYRSRCKRMEVRLGAMDLKYLAMDYEDPRDSSALPRGDEQVHVFESAEGRDSARAPTPSTLLAALELASTWRHGDVRLLVPTRRQTAHLASLCAARGVDHVNVRTLRDEAAAADPRVALKPGSLVMVVSPETGVASSRRRRVGDENPITQLQLVSARLTTADCAILCVNPKLSVPSPVAAGRTMAPLLMGDFKLLYSAEADALNVNADDTGIALYRRWPNPNYRIFARKDDHFAFVGTCPKRPNMAQLRAVYGQAHR